MFVVLGNQLFPPQHLPPAEQTHVFMAEDMGLCTYERHHQQKIVLFLAAMREYADELRTADYRVSYYTLESSTDQTYEQKLKAAIDAAGDNTIEHFEIEDKAMERRLIDFAAANELVRTQIPSPMFCTTRSEFAAFARNKAQLQMADFYRQQRRRMGVLIDDDGRPVGGQWSFDADNRKKLPRKIEPPAAPWTDPGRHAVDVIPLVKKRFASHPGDAEDFRWPTTRQQAHAWLDDFVGNRLEQFGPYEDAMSTRSETVFHSLLSPCLNIGLLTPAEVLDKVLDNADTLPLQSIEGFVRQLIGWREFVRGVYRERGHEQENQNFWSHQRELTDAWYTGSTGLPPLDETIRTAQRLGWAHHIPRLMVLGNLMTLCEIRPQSAHRWFMEMFVDSSEWVMGPNVYGMGLFSDGGVFATKPYICGSNYLLKMSDYGKGRWCDIVDGLYWRFIEKHRQIFAANPRLALMPSALDRIAPERKQRIFSAAEDFLSQHTA